MKTRRKLNAPRTAGALVRIRAEVLIDANGCWIWQGSAKGREGCQYGRIQHRKRGWYTHILAYETAIGPVPKGLVLDHLCRKPLCCNPQHLEPVTQRTNVMRSDGVAAKNAAKTHCVAGHAFTNENTYWYPNRAGMARGCITCRREKLIQWRDEHRDHFNAQAKAYNTKQRAKRKALA